MRSSLKDKYRQILQYFRIHMPQADTELHYDSPFHLLIAVILSAQCTDRRVNIATPPLFERYPDAGSLSRADFDEVFSYIKSVSYPNNKARHLIQMATELQDSFGGEVPSDIDDLMSLPGVGRKTANVIASVIYNKPVIAVDTHVFRVAHRIGLSRGKTPDAVEKDLERHIPAEDCPKAHHWLILHGRYTCTARSPHCEDCGLKQYCDEYLVSRVSR